MYKKPSLDDLTVRNWVITQFRLNCW